MKHILVTGSLAFDYIMDFPGVFADHIMPDKIHQLNVSFSVNTLKKHLGGNATNIAYSLSLLQTSTSILGTVGEDFDSSLTFLKENKIDVKRIQTIKGDVTSVAFITTDHNDNQITAFYPGALNKVHTLKIKELTPKPAFAVIAPTTPKAMTSFAKECAELHIPYMFDPGMTLPNLTDTEIAIGIRKATILIGNDYEIALLRKRLGIDDKELLKQVQILITTLGPDGSIIQTRDRTHKIAPAKPTALVDPTGAGDAYRSGFLAGFVKDFDLKTCGQMGSVAACYTVEKYGTTTHAYTATQFCKRYRENFGEELIL